MHGLAPCVTRDYVLLTLASVARAAGVYHYHAQQGNLPEGLYEAMTAMCVSLDTLFTHDALADVVQELAEVVAAFSTLSRLLQSEEVGLTEIANQIFICNHLVAQRQPRYM